MRGVVSLGIVFLSLAGPCSAEEPTPRFGVAPDLNSYPQASPRDALASVLKAIDAKRIDYLLAQLADPEFIDQRVKAHGGDFKELVKESTAKLAPDSAIVKQLRRFLKDGEWDIGDTTAGVRLKGVEDRRVYLRKAGGRWFVENWWKKGDARDKGAVNP